MDCPVDGTTLLMTEREGVEIDYCPKCRGVWLDRGELDKIIDRVADEEPVRDRDRDRDRDRAPYPSPPPPYPQQYGEPHRQPYGHPYDKKRKRKGLLGELFDFD